jgi:hypothetical protein
MATWKIRPIAQQKNLERRVGQGDRHVGSYPISLYENLCRKEVLIENVDHHAKHFIGNNLIIYK